MIFKDRDSWAEKLLGGWTISGILNCHSGFPWTPSYKNIGCGVVYAESGSNGGGWNCALRPAAYLGGALDDSGIDAFRSAGGNFPDGGTAYFTQPERTTGPPFADIVSGAAVPGPIPQAPGIERNSFRGTALPERRCDVEQGVRPAVHPWHGFGAQARDPRRLLQPVQPDQLEVHPERHPGQHFGEAQEGLGGRVIELQARFSF